MPRAPCPALDSLRARRQVDSALLRPGRFDALLYVGVPSGSAPALKVLTALTRKMTLAEGVAEALPGVMERCIVKKHGGGALTGADMYGWQPAGRIGIRGPKTVSESRFITGCRVPTAEHSIHAPRVEKSKNRENFCELIGDHD